jgi:type I restriction enzyme S subunit
MSKIDELIKQYCPEGVEYKKLSEICIKIFAGGTPSTTSQEYYGGSIPWLRSGEINFNTIKNTEILITEQGLKNSSASFINPKSVVLAMTGATVGRSGIIEIPLTANQSVCALEVNKKNMNYKFLYYCLSNDYKKIKNMGQGVLTSLNLNIIKKIIIPVPPIQVQEEIVRILDNFTNLTAELEAELENRKKQYEYYRNDLLDLENKVEYKNICEIFDIKGGYTPSKANSLYWKDGDIPWFRMEDIRDNNGSVLTESKQYINKLGVRNLFKKDSIILSTSATIGEHALIRCDFVANQRFSIFELNNNYKDRVSMEFMNYYFYKIDEWCKNNINISGFASVDMKGLKKIIIPIPLLAEQKRIVVILDKFEKLVNDMTNEGLPAEIEKRRQQYEYYRNKLLTFDEVNKNE